MLAVLGFILGLWDLFSVKPQPWGPLAWVIVFFGIILWAFGI